MNGRALVRYIKGIKKLYEIMLCKHHRFQLNYNVEITTVIPCRHLRTSQVHYRKRKMDRHPFLSGRAAFSWAAPVHTRHVQTLVMVLRICIRIALYVEAKFLLGKLQHAVIHQVPFSKVFTSSPSHFCSPLLHIIILHKCYFSPNLILMGEH